MIPIWDPRAQNQYLCIKLIFPLMYGLDNIWKSGIWGSKKNLNIEKIIFKVVQIKF